MGGLIGIKQKEYESIGCWTNYLTLSYDLDIGFSRSKFAKAVSLEWDV